MSHLHGDEPAGVADDGRRDRSVRRDARAGV